jgi:multicomponent Na+:H+ antiporter subunit B
MKLDVILRIGVKLILPFVLLFGLYVHFHGDYGPGGGFQAGVVGAAVVILYGLIFGIEAAKRLAPPALLERMVPLGVLVYVVTGLPAMFLGNRYLDYGVYAEPGSGNRTLGILLVETGVLITVFASMTVIFYALTERGR